MATRIAGDAAMVDLIMGINICAAKDITLQSLADAAALVPALMSRLEALERKVARLEAPKGQTWLTLAETANELRLSERSVSRLIKAGKLRRNLESYRVRILATPRPRRASLRSSSARMESPGC